MSGLIALMNGDYSLPVNLGNPEEHTIKEFAKIVQKEIGNYIITVFLLKIRHENNNIALASPNF